MNDEDLQAAIVIITAPPSDPVVALDADALNAILVRQASGDITALAIFRYVYHCHGQLPALSPALNHLYAPASRPAEQYLAQTAALITEIFHYDINAAIGELAASEPAAPPKRSKVKKG